MEEKYITKNILDTLLSHFEYSENIKQMTTHGAFIIGTCYRQ